VPAAGIQGGPLPSPPKRKAGTARPPVKSEGIVPSVADHEDMGEGTAAGGVRSSLLRRAVDAEATLVAIPGSEHESSACRVGGVSALDDQGLPSVALPGSVWNRHDAAKTFHRLVRHVTV